MKFTIIIPAYNVEAYIDECLASVAAQSYRDWEAIVVDDGSTDGTGEKCDEWGSKDERIRVVHQENKGQSAARNAGIRTAQGEYILFLDADDWLEPNALSLLAKQAEGEDVICFTGKRYFQAEKRFEELDVLTEQSYSRGWDYYCDNALVPRHFAFVSEVLRIYRRAFMAEHGLYFKEGIFHEDNLFTPIVLYYAGSVKVVNACLYNYRIRSGSTMTTPTVGKLFNKIEVANELAAFFKDKKVRKVVVYRYITHIYQTVFYEPQQEESELLNAVDWRSYYMVSRTKLRHRVLYTALRVSPTLFRAINNCLSR